MGDLLGRAAWAQAGVRADAREDGPFGAIKVIEAGYHLPALLFRGSGFSGSSVSSAVLEEPAILIHRRRTT